MVQESARKELTNKVENAMKIKREEIVKKEEKKEMRLPTPAKPLNGSVKDY